MVNPQTETGGVGSARAEPGDYPVTEQESSDDQMHSVAELAPREKRDGKLAPVLGSMLFKAYRTRRMRVMVRRLVRRAENGEIYSITLRRIFSFYHDVNIGMYTHGGCFIVGHMRPGTSIGRYCSIAGSARTFTANHPMNVKSSHALFVDPSLGLAKSQIFPRGKLSIGNDVWIGHNAVILPSVSSIGNGAVIGAGTVVNKNIPPYAVVTGHPCRIARYRFSEKTIEELLDCRWWERSIEELRLDLESFQVPLEGGAVR